MTEEETGEALATALDPLKMMNEMEWLYTPKPRAVHKTSVDLIAYYIRLELWMQSSKSKNALRMRRCCLEAKEKLKAEFKEKMRLWLDEDVPFIDPYWMSRG